MLFIGITGGVGAGKSEILSYLNNKPKVRVMLADEIAHDVMEPGGIAYDSICQAFAGEDIFPEEAKEAKPAFDRKKLAQVIFQDGSKRDVLNQIVHPAVKVDESLQTATEIKSTQGVVACHLCVDNNDVFIVNYLSGNIVKNGEVITQRKGKSVHPTRQTEPHTHFVGKTPDGYLAVLLRATVEV